MNPASTMERASREDEAETGKVSIVDRVEMKPEVESTAASCKVETTALVPYVPPPHLPLLLPTTPHEDGSVVPLEQPHRHQSSHHVETTTTIPYIYNDVIPLILSYCDALTLARASCVSREWHALSMCNDLWEHLCKSNFHVSSHEIQPRPDPSKNLYVVMHCQMKKSCRMSAMKPGNPFMMMSSRGRRTIPLASLTGFR